ncbi:hypothetical protein [Deinococcus soli (ex Cha et al. 2016)]|uniref:Uncharacterized protein (DUF2336 family) n=2 Tax=Deinococcus soli (ex Cha et al. 2016) TaxID=1309411 RepID=A0AAE4BP79_9DEIO|nr:hypothetical protein [Deinococcus soli (ex Cha et al. 2016)]MDR6220715.1 uncharacterized protein (DUF2336 family) [Deinococcus soli (ex Cha et al. 2016)]MDR6330758.1 uncharacterized protein (DUF2336 family) [Deinococcus soli (ex Cha et al. 2016)]MDR6753800.1 uncharacterized protein (DUF2336 family) [Deinococcus soli (ex Cha et al. 2016)]
MAGETELVPHAGVLNARTPAADLADLARHPDPGVRAQVARHPNTPAAVLGALTADFPQEVLANPALPLLRLADPHLLRGWPDAAFHALLRRPDVPVWVRTHLIRHARPELLIPLAQHPCLQEPEVLILARHAAWLVRARIAARPVLPPGLLAALAADPDYGVRLAVASRPSLPAGVAAVLRQDTSRFVRQVAEQAHPARH